MKNLFNNDCAQEVLRRIDGLQLDAERQWGQMEVAQMVAHCSATMRLAMGQRFPPRTFMGRILGPFFKHKYYDETPFAVGIKTSKSNVVSDKRDLEQEKNILKALVLQFADGGPAQCTNHPHPFFGRFSPEQWSIGMYKHLDHHLRQFGK